MLVSLTVGAAFVAFQLQQALDGGLVLRGAGFRRIWSSSRHVDYGTKESVLAQTSRDFLLWFDSVMVRSGQIPSLDKLHVLISTAYSVITPCRTSRYSNRVGLACPSTPPPAASWLRL
jgi:hypothetical protein